MHSRHPSVARAYAWGPDKSLVGNPVQTGVCSWRQGLRPSQGMGFALVGLCTTFLESRGSVSAGRTVSAGPPQQTGINTWVASCKTCQAARPGSGINTWVTSKLQGLAQRVACLAGAPFVLHCSMGSTWLLVPSGCTAVQGLAKALPAVQDKYCTASCITAVGSTQGHACRSMVAFQQPHPVGLLCAGVPYMAHLCAASCKTNVTHSWRRGGGVLLV